MEQKTVASFIKDTHFEGYLLVRAAEQRAASNGSKYLDMTLCDRTGEVNTKLWDGAVQPPQSGSVVKVRGMVIEYNGRLQMRIDKMRISAEGDNVDLSQLIPCAPYPPEQMRAEIDAVIDCMQNETLQKVLREMLKMAGDELSYYPAAQRVHHAERSGLLHHTTSMLRCAKAILSVYPWLDADLLNAGVIAHDLSKISELKSDEAGNVSDYTVDGLLLGHLVRGVERVREAANRVGEDGEYVMLLEHMVISHHGEAEFGSPRPPMFPEAEMLHWIDLVDARMNEMHAILARIPSGTFSEKIWSLDRRIYHPGYTGEQAESQSLQPTETQQQTTAAFKAGPPSPSKQENKAEMTEKTADGLRRQGQTYRPDPGKAYSGLL